MVEGQNFENGGASFSMDGRYSDYFVTWTSTDGLKQTRDATSGVNGNLHGYVKDASMPRFRPRIIVSEQIVDGITHAELVRMERTGHVHALENPEAVNEVLEKHLAHLFA